jgi:2-polyprenyl-3-methyl-5-hydroxy-6-metoxy-1,4-benzoquinol methylase
MSAGTAADARAGARLSESELCPDELLAEQEAAFARDIARLHGRKGEFVGTGCPACGSTQRRFAFSKYGFDFQHCTGCATSYMSPRPSERVMADYYANSENYAFWAARIFPASEAARRAKIHEPRFARVVEYCAHYGVPTGTLVEVGPGFGTFCAVATQSGKFRRVLAVEPTPQLAAACRARGVAVVEKRIEDAGAELPPADVLCAFEVIEHLFDPARFVADCARLLAPGGLLVLSCPNGQGFDIATLREKALAVDAASVEWPSPRCEFVSMSRISSAFSSAPASGFARCAVPTSVNNAPSR